MPHLRKIVSIQFPIRGTEDEVYRLRGSFFRPDPSRFDRTGKKHAGFFRAGFRTSRYAAPRCALSITFFSGFDGGVVDGTE